jgi:hypothetical protein
LKAKKIKAVHQTLREKEILVKSTQELLPHFLKANSQMIKNAEGKDKWNGLVENEQSEQNAAMLEQLVIKLRKKAFELLSDNEKLVMKPFIWASCGCHKNLNIVCGGYAAVMGWWGKNNIECSVLLANHDNAAILTLEGNIDIEAQAQAFKKNYL